MNTGEVRRLNGKEKVGCGGGALMRTTVSKRQRKEAVQETRKNAIRRRLRACQREWEEGKVRKQRKGEQTKIEARGGGGRANTESFLFMWGSMSPLSCVLVFLCVRLPQAGNMRTETQIENVHDDRDRGRGGTTTTKNENGKSR